MSSGIDSWLFWRDYVYVFVNPNVNEKAEKASKTAAANYALPHQKPSFNYLQVLHLNQQSLTLEEKALICGKGRQAKTLPTYAQPQRIWVADSVQYIRSDNTAAHRDSISDTSL